MIIKTTNNQTEGAVKTYLSQSLAASGTALTVKNINGFSDNWNVQIGETGEELTQIIEIAGAPSGFAINLGGTIRDAHPADTPIYCIKYNQIIFKCSTTGTAGTATALAGGTVNITPDQSFTQFDHTSGSTSYAYKCSYYSTGLAAESSDSDWLTPAGHDFYSQAKIRERIKAKALNGSSIPDGEINDWINEYLEKMNRAVVDINQDYAIGTADVAFSGTAQYGTITAADFVQPRRIEYTENGSDWYLMTKQQYTDFAPGQTYNPTHPYYHFKGDNLLGRNPHDSDGTARVSYYKLAQSLDSDADLLPFPMRGYTSSFIKWGEAQALKKDNKFTEARDLELLAERDIDQFKKELQPRGKTGPTYITMVEGWEDGPLDF